MDKKTELLKPWPGPYGGVPPWNAVQPDVLPAAFDDAIAQTKAEIEAIGGQSEPANFENTIVALEVSG
ncbi:MAG: hypothetical protein ACTHK7_02140, partial [Aureliella sp.]